MAKSGRTFVKYTTPVATAVWPKLDKPDVFTPKKGEAKVRYKINLEFEPEVAAQVKSDIEALIAKNKLDVGKNQNSPWQSVKDKDGKETGEFTLYAFSGADRKPPVFDAKNRKLPDGVAVGGGSQVKVNVTINAYDGFGGGYNLYINAVQVVELVEKGGASSPFEATDGYKFEAEDEGFPESDNVSEDAEAF
jgi:hypothetical protein